MSKPSFNISNPSRGLIAFTVMLPTLIEIIDTSIVNVSLDHIRGSLSAGYDESTWTITAYLVANAIVIPMAGSPGLSAEKTTRSPPSRCSRSAPSCAALPGA